MDALTNILATITALSEQIGPLAGKQRGMPIEADEWNALVSVLQAMLTLDRTQETSLQAQLQSDFAPIIHFHTGQVAVDWLDADLQNRLGGNGAGSVSTRLSLADMQVKVDGLGGQVGQLSTLAEDLQTRLDRAVADGLQQSAKLNGFDQRFAGIENLRGAVTGLAAQVSGLQPGIDAVLTLKQSFGDVDVAGLQQRVSSLETLGKNLLGADGSPVHLSDLEAQMSEVRDTLDLRPGSGLDDRIAAVQSQLETTLDQRVDTGLAAANTTLNAAAADTRTSLETELASKLDEAKTSIEQDTAGLVATAQTNLQASLSTSLDAAAADLRTSLSTEVSSLVTQGLSTLPAQITDAAAAAVAAATPGLHDTLAAELGQQLDTRFAASDAALSSRTDALDAKLAGFGAQLPQQIAAEAAAQLPDLVIQSVANASTSLAATLGARIDQQLAQARDGLAATVQESVSSTVANALSDLDARISAQLAPQLATLDDRIQSAAAAAVGDLDGRVAAAVASQVDALQLDTRFTNLAGQLTAQWKSDLAAGLQNSAADSANALSSAVDTLRAAIGTSHDDALNSALDAVDKAQASIEDDLKTSTDTLTAQIAAAQKSLNDQFTAQLTAAVSQVETDIGSSVNTAVTGLRTELATTRDALSADFEKQLETLNGTLTTTINTSMNRVLTTTQRQVQTLSTAIMPRLTAVERAVNITRLGAAAGPVTRGG